MNDQEIAQAKQLLSALEPGFLPEPIFHEFTRLSVTGILELVPLRKSSDAEIEVLVLERAQNDPHWPGMLHTPGTVLRPTDTDDFSSALARAFGEINRSHTDFSVQQVTTIFHTVNRGKELSVVFATQIYDTQDSDMWIPLSSIDAKVIDTQRTFIRLAIDSLLKQLP